MTQGDERYADPTWAPDNAGHRVREQRRHHRHALHRVRAGQVRGAERRDPDGDRLPARLGSRRRARRRLQGAGGQARSGRPGADARSRPAVKLAIVKAKGKAVTVTVPAAGKVKVTVTRKGKTIATATATAKQAGTVTVRFKKAPKGKGLTLKLTFSGKTVTKKLG